MIAKNDYVAGAGDPVDADDLNNIADVANAGAGLRDSILMGEAFTGATTPQPAYVSISDNKLYRCDGNDTGKLRFAGFVKNTGAANDDAEFQGSGIVGGFSGLDEGQFYYVQDAVGTIGLTPGTYSVRVGLAITATEILIMRNPMKRAGTVSMSNSVGGSANVDTTVDLGWRPSMIVLDYFIQGKTADGGSAKYIAQSGKAVYGPTGTLVANYVYMSGQGATSSLSVPDGIEDMIFDEVNTTVPDVGDDGTGTRTIMSINSVTATGFVVRMAKSGSGGYPAILRATWEAHE